MIYYQQRSEKSQPIRSRRKFMQWSTVLKQRQVI